MDTETRHARIGKAGGRISVAGSEIVVPRNAYENDCNISASAIEANVPVTHYAITRALKFSFESGFLTNVKFKLRTCISSHTTASFVVFVRTSDQRVYEIHEDCSLTELSGNLMQIEFTSDSKPFDAICIAILENDLPKLCFSLMGTLYNKQGDDYEAKFVLAHRYYSELSCFPFCVIQLSINGAVEIEITCVGKPKIFKSFKWEMIRPHLEGYVETFVLSDLPTESYMAIQCTSASGAKDKEDRRIFFRALELGKQTEGQSRLDHHDGERRKAVEKPIGDTKSRPLKKTTTLLGGNCTGFWLENIHYIVEPTVKYTDGNETTFLGFKYEELADDVPIILSQLHSGSSEADVELHGLDGTRYAVSDSESLQKFLNHENCSVKRAIVRQIAYRLQATQCRVDLNFDNILIQNLSDGATCKLKVWLRATTTTTSQEASTTIESLKNILDKFLRSCRWNDCPCDIEKYGINNLIENLDSWASLSKFRSHPMLWTTADFLQFFVDAEMKLKRLSHDEKMEIFPDLDKYLNELGKTNWSSVFRRRSILKQTADSQLRELSLSKRDGHYDHTNVADLVRFHRNVLGHYQDTVQLKNRYEADHGVKDGDDLREVLSNLFPNLEVWVYQTFKEQEDNENSHEIQSRK